jgi:Uma2 family endonuclease
MLVVEVADTSYRIDRDFKTSLYARAGVPECWIIDVARGVVEVHRAPERTATTIAVADLLP